MVAVLGRGGGWDAARGPLVLAGAMEQDTGEEVLAAKAWLLDGVKTAVSVFPPTPRTVARVAVPPEAKVVVLPGMAVPLS